jgi:hypothetical protein
MIKGGDLLLDTDDSRQISSNILLPIIKILLFIMSRFYIINLYIIGNKNITNTIQGELYNEGYYIKDINKFIYIIYPILYGERK